MDIIPYYRISGVKDGQKKIWEESKILKWLKWKKDGKEEKGKKGQKKNKTKKYICYIPIALH